MLKNITREIAHKALEKALQRPVHYEFQVDMLVTAVKGATGIGDDVSVEDFYKAVAEYGISQGVGPKGVE